MKTDISISVSADGKRFEISYRMVRSYRGYGIICRCGDSIAYVADAADNYREALSLLCILSGGNVFPCHLYDVISDLATQSYLP